MCPLAKTKPYEPPLFHQIDSSVCTDINHEAFRPVFSTFTVLLVDMNLSLNLKVTERIHTVTILVYLLSPFLFVLLIKVNVAV